MSTNNRASVPEPYKRLNLPVYDGVEEELEKQNENRKKAFDIFKSEKTMRRRVALNSLTVQKAQEHILWTKQHGGSRETIQEEKKDDCEQSADSTHIPCQPVTRAHTTARKCT